MRYLVGFVFFFLFVVSFGNVQNYGFCGRKEIELWGLGFQDKTLKLAFSDEVKDRQTRKEIAKYVLTALAIGGGQFYVNLGAGWLGKEVPLVLLFCEMGRELVEMDLLLKKKVRQILSDLSDERIYEYWRSVSLLGSKLVDSIYVEVMPVYANFIYLRDAVMLSSVSIEVLVGIAGGKSEEDFVVDDDLVSLLREKLSDIVNTSREFSPLRRMIRASLLVNESKHRMIDGKIASSIQYGISKDRIGGIYCDEMPVMELIGQYFRLISKPFTIRMFDKEITINGAIDLIGRGIEAQRKEIDVNLEKAIEVMGEGWIWSAGKLVWKKKEDIAKLVDKLEDKIKTVPKWKFWVKQKNERLVHFVLAEFLGRGSNVKESLPIEVDGKLVKDFINDCLNWLNQKVSAYEGIDRYRFYVSYVNGEKEDGIWTLYLREVSLGRLPFVRAFFYGVDIAVEMDTVNKRFYKMLLVKLNKGILKWVKADVRQMFWDTVSELWEKERSIVWRTVKLLATVQQYSYAIDRRIIRPWFLLRGWIMDKDGWDIGMFDGLVFEGQDE